jgi:Nucleotidyl transferase AbiEii toxin, Type IV TA system
LEAIVELGMLNTRFKDYFDLHYLAHKFSFEGALLSKAIAGTFERRGTSFPEGLPVGLTPTFGNDTAKIRGWEAFWRKTGPKAEAPKLQAVVQLLVQFLGPPLDAAAKGPSFRATWKSSRWSK